ncbi:hypothetical protein SK571_11785 [Lentzea sp. BCCO 10_0798]|uniref:Uncharacterized protein n=1 Tax=Lentzea kristufekii TaxID=3095430 RepID=A0ABU4TP62_9PSEU|nr:hypothetical protein [Lentzea sp. BCCO 10_0798]MDX8050062.1 hypothetical protein [Lentzea sp. BCCO 10_0798]
MSTQEIRQFGVVLVAAGPGLALAAFVAGMTLPLHDFVRAMIAGMGVAAAFSCVCMGVVVFQVPDLPRLAKLLRFWLVIPFTTGTVALSTLYTDHPEVDGLLTSLSSVVFTIAVVASMLVVTFFTVQVDQSAKRGPRCARALETFSL